MPSQTLNAIYIGTIGDSGIFDIDFKIKNASNTGPYTQSDQPNDPGWATNGGLSTGDTGAEGSGLFIGRTYSSPELREITLTTPLTSGGASDYNLENDDSTDSITEGGVSSTFEGTGRLYATLSFNNGSGGTVTVANVQIRVIQDVSGRTYIVDTYALPPNGPANAKDLGDVISQYGMNNLVSIAPTSAAPFGANHRTSPETTFGANSYYDSRGSVSSIRIEGSPENQDGIAQSIVPCYTAGTLIQTGQGEIAIENLANGDEVLNRDGVSQPIIWMAKSTVLATGSNSAVVIPAGVFGLRREMIVSQQHCMVVSVGGKENFVKAKFLAESNWSGCHFYKETEITYYHMLLAQHAIIQANGGWSESFYPGVAIMNALHSETRASLLKAIPSLGGCETADDVIVAFGPTALPRLTRAQFKRLFLQVLTATA